MNRSTKLTVLFFIVSGVLHASENPTMLKSVKTYNNITRCEISSVEKHQVTLDVHNPTDKVSVTRLILFNQLNGDLELTYSGTKSNNTTQVALNDPSTTFYHYEAIWNGLRETSNNKTSCCSVS